MNTIERIPYTTKEAWLQARSLDVTSTEVSALYGLSPYLTEFELWHRKVAAEVTSFEPNERMKWGTALEPVIAASAAEENNWIIRRLDCYARIPEARMGASFDYEILVDDGPNGILEIKNVDGLVFNRTWVDHGDGNLEAPEHIELQVQHQLEVYGLDYAYIVALVGGNSLKVIRRERDRVIGADIALRVAAFWVTVHGGTPPKPEFPADNDFICKTLRANANGGEVAHSTPEIDELLERYRHAASELSSYEEIKDTIKARLLDRIGTASKILSPLGTVTCGTTKDSVGTLITPDMVGTYYGARRGYRQFRFTPSKETT